MSYTFEKITKKDIDVTEFERVYDECSSHMNANYPWTTHGVAADATDTDKKNYFRRLFNISDKHEYNFIWRVKEGSRVLTYNLGALWPADEGFNLHWNVSLIGSDSEGSKAYLYDSGYLQTAKAFWKEHNIKKLYLTFASSDSSNSAWQNASNRQSAVTSESIGSFAEPGDSVLTLDLS